MIPNHRRIKRQAMERLAIRGLTGIWTTIQVSGSGKPFTKAQKKKMLAENEAANDGLLRDDVTGEAFMRPQKRRGGVRRPKTKPTLTMFFRNRKGRV